MSKRIQILEINFKEKQPIPSCVCLPPFYKYNSPTNNMQTFYFFFKYKKGDETENQYLLWIPSFPHTFLDLN